MGDSTQVQLYNALVAHARRLTWSATVSGQPLRCFAASIDHGYDVVSSAATLTVREMPIGITEPRGQTVIIRAGYNGAQVVRFTGYLEDVKPGFWPGSIELRCAGRLRKAQYDYHDEVTYTDQHDEYIVGDLLTKCGIPADLQNLDGESHHFGVSADVVLPAGVPVWSPINRLDALTGYNTFDSPDGMVLRRDMVHSPSASASWAYEEGVNCFGGRRVKSRADVRNKVRVEGLPLVDGTEVVAVNQADSVYIPNPPRYVVYTITEDLVEDDTYAAVVAAREMLRRNKMLDNVEDLEAPGNPFLRPGMTVSVKGYELDLPNPGYYYVRHHHEEIGDQGYTSTLTLEGGIGDAGYQLLPPVAAFTVECDLETVDIAGTGEIRYAVICDGSAAYDPDNTPGGMTYAWSNDQTADVGTGVTYSFLLTAAELAGPCLVTLVVTDAELLTGTLVREVVGSTTSTLSRVMFSAAGSQAEATQDGWQTYNVWAPGGGVLVISTPEQAYEDASYFGCDDGRLVYTSDFLATAPTLVHTFGSAVTSIWLHETQVDRITVGLASGEVWLSTDAGVTWTLLYTFAAAVYCVKESPMSMGQFWVTSGVYQYVLYEGVATPAALATFPAGTVARWTSNSFFGNFVSATVGAASGDAPVRGADDGSELTFPAMAPAAEVEDVRAITHHLYLDILWACDLLGRWFVKAEGETTFAYVGTMPGSPGDVNHMLRDTTLQNLTYVQCADGLYKTPDAGTTFYLLRDYTAAGLVGYQVGLGSLRLRVATGRRVFVAGADRANYPSAGNPFVAWCDNIYATPPVWTKIATGLPAAPGTPLNFYLDPTNYNRGYLQLGNVSIYYCADLQGDGGWTEIVTEAMLVAWRTALGIINPVYEAIIIDMAVDKDGILVIYWRCADAGIGLYSRITHSHDQGVTFIHADDWLRGMGGGVWSAGWRTPFEILPQTGSPGSSYAVQRSTVDNIVDLFRSDNTYHTWACKVQGYNPGNGIVAYALLAFDPSVPSDRVLFMAFVIGSGAANTKYVGDGFTSGVPVADYSTDVGHRPIFPQDGDTSVCMGDNGTEAYPQVSVDKGVTYTQGANVGPNLHYVGLTAGLWLIHRDYSATPYIWYCRDRAMLYANWVNIVGNLGTDTGTPGMREVDGMQVDPEV